VSKDQTTYTYDVRGVYVAASDANRIQIRLMADGVPIRTWRIDGATLLHLLLQHGAH